MAGIKEVRRETLHYEKEWHNPNLDVLEMAPVLLNSGWLLLWIIAICSLSGEDDGTTIPWHNGIHCTVDNSTPPGSNCGAKGGCLLPEDSHLFLRTIWLELSDLLWHVSALVFNPCAFPWSMARPGILALALGAWAVCLHIQTSGKHCNSLHSCYGERGKWSNLLWIHLSKASASGSWSHLLLLAPWSLTLACLQLIYCFVKCLLFFSSICISVTREMILTIWV